MQPPQREQLRRQCLRGMLELDLLLETFLDHCYDDLSDQQKLAFQRLLTTPDPQLNAWILGTETASEEAFQPLIRQLRTVMCR